MYGTLKVKVYVCQAEGFVKILEDSKVYKLEKALYGLRKSRRVWNLNLNNNLNKMGYQRRLQESVVYESMTNGEFINIAVYIDYLFMTGTILEFINRTRD